ncbi:MAG: cytochrome c oxidase accessory protein CcoG [Myxococcota bacterium]
MDATVPPTTAPSSRALRPDGTRARIHPKETNGRYTRLQQWLYPALILFYAALPWVPVGGHPAVWIDIPQRRFYLFGLTFNSTDFYLVFFIISGFAFSLVVLSALVGRVWCGYACPQTVYIDGVYRKLERLVEGTARERQAREQGPWTAERVARKALKHVLFVLVSLLIAHVFLAYFATAEDVLEMMQRSPLENPTPFAWVMAITGLLYFNFGWFREQFCLVLCPYGRMQSVLVDRDTVTVGYDALRGEPRGKLKGEAHGDCVDCRMCVQACPTGIDIRNGMQMECIACAHCVDACNEVMVKIGKPTGLIRYDSLAGLEHAKRQFWRPRVYGYIVAGLAGLTALTLAVNHRKAFEANLLWAQAAPRTVQGEQVVHRMVVHLNSKTAEARTYQLSLDAPEGAQVILPTPAPTLEPFGSVHLPVMVVTSKTSGGERKVTLHAKDSVTGEVRSAVLKL